MISKAFAEKLKKTLPLLISQNQRACVHSRCVSESGRPIANINDTFDKESVPGYLVTMDVFLRSRFS